MGDAATSGYSSADAVVHSSASDSLSSHEHGRDVNTRQSSLNGVIYTSKLGIDL